MTITELTVKSAMVSMLVKDIGKTVKTLPAYSESGLVSAYKSNLLKQAYRSACSLAAALDALSAKEKVGG